MTEYAIADLPARLIAKISNAESGCWNWTGATNSKGYGRVRWGSRQPYAHRVVFHLLADPTLPMCPGWHGLKLDHLCRNKTCVNPAHLEPVTNAVNMRRHWAIVAPLPGVAFGEVRHGSTATYSAMGCRCPQCRAATRDARIRRARALAADDPRHGTANAYRTLACRCEPCRAAGSIANRATTEWRRQRAVNRSNGAPE